MIFIDSNIPMYLVGADHPNKLEAQRMLDRAITSGERLVTDAEVFQEVLLRYAAIRRPEAIGPAFDALLGVVDEVFDITLADVRRARETLGSLAGCSARDAVHAATMERSGAGVIMTFDRGFERYPALRIF